MTENGQLRTSSRSSRVALLEVGVSDDIPQIGLDRPLKSGSALSADKLGRIPFAQSVVGALSRVSSTAGFVLSVEGVWGSGKSSTLALIEDLLSQQIEAERPIVVHFNPWLVGDRDALLRQFLAKIASTVKLADHAKNAQKVVKELKAYGKVFDVVKMIPGAEPWASIIKSVVDSVGDATASVSEYKTPDIEKQKLAVEAALLGYHRRIVVFIDDIDRLFPAEVYEMVRIVKAIGELPNVGYVLAWDPIYVSDALEKASVPQANGYLDKIVQVRMPLPSLSMAARGRLINDALASLSDEVHGDYFPNASDRISLLYFSGLRDVLEQPRDFTRVFNTVGVIEPSLRGEVVFSDILGLAALMIKAPTMFDVLRRQPRYFVGKLPFDSRLSNKSESYLKDGVAKREEAMTIGSAPEATRDLVHFLFPATAKPDGAMAIQRVSDVEGHLAHPTRLLVALQSSIGPTDVSLVQARDFLAHRDHRDAICATLTAENCVDFLESLGDIASASKGKGINDLDELCVSIAKMIDVDPICTVIKERQNRFFARAGELVAVRAILEATKSVQQSKGPHIAELLVKDEQVLTIAAHLLVGSYLSDSDMEEPVVCPAGRKSALLRHFAANVLAAAKRGKLLSSANPGFILWNLARLAPASCKSVFASLRAIDPTLDGFALEILRHSFSSDKGQTYALPDDKDVFEAYVSIATIRRHAKKRLMDSTLNMPTRAAWLSVVEGKVFYGVDATQKNR
jgi:hypothetical protein